MNGAVAPDLMVSKLSFIIIIIINEPDLRQAKSVEDGLSMKPNSFSIKHMCFEMASWSTCLHDSCAIRSEVWIACLIRLLL